MMRIVRAVKLFALMVMCGCAGLLCFIAAIQMIRIWPQQTVAGIAVVVIALGAWLTSDE